MTKLVANEPNDLGRYFVHYANAGVVDGLAALYEPGRRHPALVSGDLALTATTLTTGEVTVEVARRQPDGSWLWAVSDPAVAR